MRRSHACYIYAAGGNDPRGTRARAAKNDAYKVIDGHTKA